jgi:GxxExxY protein
MIGDRGDVRGPPVADQLTHAIIEAIINVHRSLGPGFLESIYHRALIVELRKQALQFETEVDIPIRYAGELVGRHPLDLVIDRHIIVELKTVEALSKAHYSQVRSYLKATGLPLALLVNFASEKADYRRVENV